MNEEWVKFHLTKVESDPGFFSVLNVQAFLRDVSEIEVASDVKAADDVVDDDIDFIGYVGVFR